MTTSLPTLEKPIPSQNGEGNILVIEDDAEINEVIVFSLALDGYGVRGVTSREAALDALHENTFQVILMDLYMPGMAPGRFVREVRQISPETRFILMTAAPQVREEAHKLGIDTWLGKPFSLDQLMETIKTGP